MTTQNKTVRTAFGKHIPCVAISLLGFGGIFVIQTVFDRAMKNNMLAEGVMPIAYDNFHLYFELSLIICAVLLGLTLLSSVTYIIQSGKKSNFTRLTVKASPVICSVAMIMVSAFYAYLTYDSDLPIVNYLLLLGVCEAALFLFPFTLTKTDGAAETYKKN